MYVLRNKFVHFIIRFMYSFPFFIIMMNYADAGDDHDDDDNDDHGDHDHDDHDDHDHDDH